MPIWATKRVPSAIGLRSRPALYSPNLLKTSRSPMMRFGSTVAANCAKKSSSGLSISLAIALIPFSCQALDLVEDLDEEAVGGFSDLFELRDVDAGGCRGCGEL